MFSENSGINGNNSPLIPHILVIEDQAHRRTIILDEANYSLGRHSNNAIQMYSRQASRHHATLVRKFNAKTNQFTYLILDGDLQGNKSQNGIFINGEKCLVHELKDGDLINFGCDVNASYHNLSRQENPFLNSSLSAETNADLELENLSTFEGSIQEKEILICVEDDTDSKRDNDDTFADYSYLDSLTGLPNQTLFNEYLYIAVSNAKRHQHHVAILLIDLDNFSIINQSLGDKVGDKILKDISKSIRARLRNGDIVARWQGNTFGILLPQIQEVENLNAIVQRILSTIQQSITIDGNCLQIQAHHAVVIYPQDAIDSQEMLNILENRLDQSKSESQFAPSSSLELSHRRSRVEKRLHRAIENEELKLYYQPQVNLKTGEIEAMEAFVRWHHPQQGLITPKQFLPWADKTELINPLSQWILMTACKQNIKWQQEGISPIIMSVNLSEKQFYHPNFSNLLNEILTETKLDPHWLELEITESFIMQDLEEAKKIIRPLHQLGIRFSLDDFGKHYASIRYLQELPINKIKIDQSFIAKLAANPQATEMISALIDLGKNFNLQVVAEGVETQSQLNILQNLQCFLMQGYRFSQPMQSEDAQNFLLLHRASSR